MTQFASYEFYFIQDITWYCLFLIQFKCLCYVGMWNATGCFYFYSHEHYLDFI